MPTWNTTIGYDPENSRKTRVEGRISILRSINGSVRQLINFAQAYEFLVVYNNITAAQAATLETEAETDIGSLWDLQWHDGNTYQVVITEDFLGEPDVNGGRRWTATIGFTTYTPGS